MMDELKPCPFVGGGDTRLIVCDSEGNIRGNVGCDYESDPYSGLTYGLIHTHEHGDCPIQGEELLGGWLYDTKEEAILAWNARAEKTCRLISRFNGSAF